MNNFTPRAQQVLAHARREADRFNHHYIGTEHLLLGLLKLGKGVAVTILENLGVELSAVRKQVEEQIGRGTEPQAEGNIPYTPRVRKVLAMANREAQELNHTYVGTEHLLLGLIRDGDGVAGQILRHFGVDLEQARRELLDVLTPKYQMDADEDNIIPDDDDDEEENESPAIPTDEPSSPSYSRQQKSKTPASWPGTASWTPSSAAPPKLSASSRSCAAGIKTTPSCSVKPGWARPPSWKGWPRK